MAAKQIRLLDGGFSTQIIYHLDITERECNNHPLWCTRFLTENPLAVINTHRDYIRAGSEIIITNSYQASVDGFQRNLCLSASESLELICSSVKLAKKAVELEEKTADDREEDKSSYRKVYIAGSVGSYGACLHDGSEYRGDYIKDITKETLKEWHRPRISALVAEGVDYLAVETMPALMEAEAVQELLKEFPNQEYWISFTCKDEQHTVYGDHIEQVGKSLWSKNMDGRLIAVGVNCLHPSLVTTLTKTIANSCKNQLVPTIAYPNNGDKYDDKQKKWVRQNGYPALDEYFAEWVKSGVSIIGGCCKTTATDIRLFRDYLDKPE